MNRFSSVLPTWLPTARVSGNSRTNHPLLTAAALLAAMIGGNALVGSPPEAFGGGVRLAWRLLDSPVHALQALLVVAPLWFGCRSRRDGVTCALLAGAAAVLLDLDHVMAARNVSLAAITSLHRRPETHSLTFAAAAGLLSYALSRRKDLALAVSAALAAHVLYDASTGATPFLWPLPVYHLAPMTAYGAVVALHWATWVCRFSSLKQPSPPQSRPPLPAQSRQ